MKASLEHSHALSLDLFVFIQHQNRGPDSAEANNLAIGMRTSHTTYGQAKRTFWEHGPLLNRKDYYNLQQSIG